MTHRPLVSVCIPNYNNAAYLEQAIRSALDQTVADLEVIVCDNQSTDNSLEVARGIDDARLHVYENEANLGIYGNFTRTTGHARGQYLKFLCADDWLEPTYLAATLACFEQHPDLGLVTTDQATITDAGEIVTYRRGPKPGQVIYTTEEYLATTLRRPNPIGNPTRVIVPRTVFDAVGGFDVENEFSGDLDLWLRIVARYPVAALPEVHCSERSHPGQNTAKLAKQARTIQDEVRAFKRSFADVPEFWTPARRAALARHALAPAMRQGIAALAQGKVWYWRQVLAAMTEVAPRRAWLPYHLVAAPLGVIRIQFLRWAKAILKRLR